jgi:hypothetical protein
VTSWILEEIRDTLYYQFPCHSEDWEVNLSYTPSPGARSYVEETKYVTVLTGREVRVNMSGFGRRSVSIEVWNSLTRRTYTIILERSVALFDVVDEQAGRTRIVNNNPETNTTGMQFASCKWWRRQEADSGWILVASDRFYYNAGASVHDKFTTTDSMYLELYTIEGAFVRTCPDVGSSVAVEENPRPLEEEAVYPNPVIGGGGTVRIKHSLMDNGGSVEELQRYTHYRLYNILGTLISFGDAAPLYDEVGLTMPDFPGTYLLILERQGKKRCVKIAVLN